MSLSRTISDHASSAGSLIAAQLDLICVMLTDMLTVHIPLSHCLAWLDSEVVDAFFLVSRQSTLVCGTAAALSQQTFALVGTGGGSCAMELVKWTYIRQRGFIPMLHDQHRFVARQDFWILISF